MRIIFAGGGTGGHLYPNIAIARGIKGEILFVVGKSELDKEVMEKFNFQYKQIFAGKLRRYFDLRNITDLFNFFIGILQSIIIIINFKPNIIFCKGGYISLPVAIAGWILRKKIILHESDSVVGIANKITSFFSNRIIMGLSENLNPIMYDENKIDLQLIEKLRSKGKKILFVTGGSQGAKQINDIIIDIFEKIKKDFFVIHLTGKGKQTTIVDESYVQFEYLSEEYFSYLISSDIVIGRAGASSIAEFICLKKPSILIPLSGSAGDHQEINAKIIGEKGLAIYLSNSEINSENIIQILYNQEKIGNIKNNLEKEKNVNTVNKIIEIINNINLA